jgi:hypothetical protein
MFGRRIDITGSLCEHAAKSFQVIAYPQGDSQCRIYAATRNAEAFIESILKSCAEEFNLAYKPEIVRRKMHLSELIVRSTKDLIGINPKLTQIAEKISELLPANIKLPYEFAGVMIAPVQGISNINIAPFRFERKNNSSPDENKFYSTAPIHTDEHLKLLEWFEEQFMR